MDVQIYDSAPLETLISAWEAERTMRRELRDTMALDENRQYQQGFGDGLDHAIHTLKAAMAVRTAATQERKGEVDG